jgi:hypothetical protein
MVLLISTKSCKEMNDNVPCFGNENDYNKNDLLTLIKIYFVCPYNHKDSFLFLVL